MGLGSSFFRENESVSPWLGDLAVISELIDSIMCIDCIDSYIILPPPHKGTPFAHEGKSKKTDPTSPDLHSTGSTAEEDESLFYELLFHHLNSTVFHQNGKILARVSSDMIWNIEVKRLIDHEHMRCFGTGWDSCF